MAGICFGHQLMAQALGGTVRKSEKGWGIGRHVYDVMPNNGVIGGEKDRDRRFASGPGDRASRRRNDNFPFGVHTHAGLLYANGTAMSVQPHPEFTVAFADGCCEKAGHNGAPGPLVASAKASLEQPLDHADLGSAIARFLAKPRNS